MAPPSVGAVSTCGYFQPLQWSVRPPNGSAWQTRTRTFFLLSKLCFMDKLLRRQACPRPAGYPSSHASAVVHPTLSDWRRPTMSPEKGPLPAHAIVTLKRPSVPARKRLVDLISSSLEAKRLSGGGLAKLGCPLASNSIAATGRMIPRERLMKWTREAGPLGQRFTFAQGFLITILSSRWLRSGSTDLRAGNQRSSSRPLIATWSCFAASFLGVHVALSFLSSSFRDLFATGAHLLGL
jgi:hypothetical protein